jgi:hypothetical protein
MEDGRKIVEEKEQGRAKRIQKAKIEAAEVILTEAENALNYARKDVEYAEAEVIKAKAALQSAQSAGVPASDKRESTPAPSKKGKK